MTAIKINASYTILMFDGEVLEIFPGQRIHISQINDIELTQDRHGKHTIKLASPISNWGMAVDEQALPAVTQLIADFHTAKSQFRF